MRINFLATIVLAVLLFACSDEVKQSDDLKIVGHKIEVEEVVQANAYTYLRVSENSAEYWIAITKNLSIEEGAVLYYKEGLEMKNFESKDLNKTFETIIFIQEISDVPFTEKAAMTDAMQGQKPVLVKEDINIDPVSGGITIAELYSNSDSYSNKVVKIKGKVTKYNASIMDRNWIHLQDGTNDGDNFDLTVTTNDEVKLGEIVVFEGRISLNKDFGAGYSYAIIMEDSKLIK
ncbi:MAG: SH3-like domain-containing protein [Bacteroidetes bacterium]|nr:SH3-like domain-containing protein [Bacteroidota bacterium]